MSRVGKVAGALIEHGRPGDTPVSVTQQGTTTSQQTVVATLDTVGTALPLPRTARRRRRSPSSAPRCGPVSAVLVGEPAAVRVDRARPAHPRAGGGDGRPAARVRRPALGGAHDRRRAAPHAGPDGPGDQGAGLRPVPVDRVHLGQRGEGDAGQARRVRPRRTRLRRRPDRRGRREHRRRVACLRHQARARCPAASSPPRACSPSGRTSTACSTPSTGCCCPGPTSRPRPSPPG